RPTRPLLTVGFSTVVHALVDPVTVDMVMAVAATVSNRTDANSTDPAGGVAAPVVRLLTNAGSDLTDAQDVSSARVMSQPRARPPPVVRFNWSRLWWRTRPSRTIWTTMGWLEPPAPVLPPADAP